MTDTESSEPREWWINEISVGRSMINRRRIFSATEEITQNLGWVHVIEHSAYLHEKSIADAMTANSMCARAERDKQVERVKDFSDALDSKQRLLEAREKQVELLRVDQKRLYQVEQERDAYKKAKEENDERFQLEIGELRAELAQWKEREKTFTEMMDNSERSKQDLRAEVERQEKIIDRHVHALAESLNDNVALKQGLVDALKLAINEYECSPANFPEDDHVNLSEFREAVCRSLSAFNGTEGKV